MERKKILFVDDEVSLTRIIKMNLEAMGRYQVQVANEGSAALETARAFRPDMIFLDVVMPDMEGTEVACKIEADEGLKNVPIVFMTAIVSNEELEQHSGQIGGRPFLAKPATVQQIVTCIREHLFQ